MNKKEKEKIFIIEDEAILLYSLEAKFSTYNLNVITHQGTGTIEGIVGNVATLQPQYIILDLILPKIDGFELLKSLKSHPETTNIPIFIFTNLSDKQSKSKGKSLGSDYYFIKSDFIIDEFVTKVLKIIKNRKKIKK
jgi:DNA-binding response OmpR family regulator